MYTRSESALIQRKTITLDDSKVVKDADVEGGLKIVRTRAPAVERSRVDLPGIEPWTVPMANRPPIAVQRAPNVDPRPAPEPVRESCTVLVVNASLDMARELTVELTTTIPGCNILFAPTLSLALWILKRRSIDVILSSAVLPDGPLAKLHEFLELMTPPPELVILSELSTTGSQMQSHPGYRFVELRRLSRKGAEIPQEEISTTISELGADLRNDLNNPLQEIVAMAFVAQTSNGLSPVAEQALGAIERAAGNMASIVEKLEDKIRGVVSRSAA